MLVLNPAHFPYFVLVAHELTRALNSHEDAESNIDEGVGGVDGDTDDGDGSKEVIEQGGSSMTNGREGASLRLASPSRDGRDTIGGISGKLLPTTMPPSVAGGLNSQATRTSLVGDTRLDVHGNAGSNGGNSGGGSPVDLPTRGGDAGDSRSYGGAINAGVAIGAIARSDGTGPRDGGVWRNGTGSGSKEKSNDGRRRPGHGVSDAEVLARILNETLMQRLGSSARHYAGLWQMLGDLREKDPFPAVVKAAEAVREVILDQVAAMKIERGDTGGPKVTVGGESGGDSAREGQQRGVEGVSAPAPAAVVTSGTVALTAAMPVPTDGERRRGGQLELGPFQSHPEVLPSARMDGIVYASAIEGRRRATPGANTDSNLPVMVSTSASPIPATTLQRIRPPARSRLDSPFLFHAFYKWSCRGFSEPGPPAAMTMTSPAASDEDGRPLSERESDYYPPEDYDDDDPRSKEAGGSEDADAATVEGSSRNEDDMDGGTRGNCERNPSHPHDPIDALRYEGALTLYFKKRNLRVHAAAEVRVDSAR